MTPAKRLFVLSVLSVPFVLSPRALLAAAPQDWIALEKIRAGWIYHSDGPDKLHTFKRLGMNALVTHARNREAFDQWAKEARRAGMHLFGVLGFSARADKMGVRRAVFGNGYESVVACPTDERFWRKQMIEPAVELARQGMTAEREISGILIDFELYANSAKGGQIYYNDACYCDHCFGGFLKHRGLEADPKAIPFDKRKQWLKDKGIDIAKDYHPFLQKQVRAIATIMRQEVEKVRKDFFVGFYPRPHNWMLVGTAQGLGTPEHPMILWATSTYGGGGPDKVKGNWRDLMREQDIHCYYCAGMLLRFYTSTNLAANMVHIARKCNGYWLFTVHTLCLPEDRQTGDYYLASGSPQDYSREIARANAELDKLCADPAYITPLKFVPEPVLYRQVGYSIHQLRVPELLDKSTAERGKDTPVPALSLIGSKYLMMQLVAGEEAVLRFQTHRSKSKYVWGVSYAVVDGQKQVVAEGKLPPGEEPVVRFTAPRAGIYTMVLVPGYYGWCKVLSTTVPFALWTGGKFEISVPGGTVYFHVPEGLTEFGLSARCHWGTQAVKLTVADPDGSTVKAQETDPFVRSVELKVPTGGKTGRLWSLKVERVGRKRYRSAFVRFDKRLPAMVTVSPKFVFTEAKGGGPR